MATAKRTYDRARALGADLPPFAALLAEWSAQPGVAATVRAPAAIPAGAGEGATPRACGPDQAETPPHSRDEGGLNDTGDRPCSRRNTPGRAHVDNGWPATEEGTDGAVRRA